ncbi:MAG: DUF2752 domain-containing protein [Alphaproteobacteria bacterium]|nr:DUF2752 domain-containing protein [Alphaproteobacteria bacterium]
MELSESARARLLSLGLGLPSWAVLSIAAWLTPSPAGHGTHQQLGLGQCTLLGLTGYPCPMCGMTTTFSHMAHLQPLAALVTQPFGVVLFAGTCFVASVAVVELVAPRGRWTRLLEFVERWELAIASSLLVGLVLGWVYKVTAMGLGPLAG